ncbi:hypothetical protein CH253_18145 [Rhodococcus sp. 06-156-3C]|uniref:DEAD/DEAH box helicase n=1 Tax=Nocardiaceae TaxID=85025 RepID=UPI0009B8F77C|nr:MULTISPECIES: DEAD/DEAH box helicase [Rhodococcus]OZD12990.1 hypothetical protein CH248_27345 [Rhodococcus sp. 06-156-4a]OZD17858.1 hypothetical protein CH253_18145 [Rhodococcus sp. 06-156-3C]OZD20584.1 hypothetical protein CH280_03300 [Rhodococcus sp. 06-156-4C]OZD30698.1 hypothetical protein CH247_15430 [Rhodococcus sp. 06-156-3b]OZD32528.1 hypothetical protein CH284_19830 [Rhodococcus sp. 06-156-3]
MKFYGLFIGIDRYADSRVNWLQGAVRDAQAVHALFSDTLDGQSHTLLTDEDATADAIRSCLANLAIASNDEDIVVIFYAGHGTDRHQIICHDTDVEKLTGTTVSLEEIGKALSAIPGRTVLCALDCCFSGGIGSRVFQSEVNPRDFKKTDPTEILSKFLGKGRLAFTASAEDEEALESAKHGHGLFTYRLIEALQGVEGVEKNGQIDLINLVHYVSARVTADASQMGHVQTPTLRGQFDGTPLWPIFKPGSVYKVMFPGRVREPATSDLLSLLPYGISQSSLDAWAGTITQLNDLQIRAVNEFGVLDDSSLVVTAPTSSGKTMIGELAALRAASRRGRTIFLLPIKALVNDKYEHFTKIYESSGIKTIRATGDYSDQVSEFLRGQFDFALLTYEKMSYLALSNPHVLGMPAVVVVDEAQTLTDKNRGSNLEFLLTILNNRRGQTGTPQIITLSAVVGDLKGLDLWLGGKNLHTDKRPVPLREGVLHRNGDLQFLDENGDESFAHMFVNISTNTGQTRDTLIPLARMLLGENKKIIVFRQTKGEAVACSRYLADALGLPSLTDISERISEGEASTSTASLQQVLSKGVAFHTADLDRIERATLEGAFRNPDSGLNLIVATPTLAMGVNTPASAVIIVGLTHPIDNPYTVAEYKNMVGRAGRLGFTDFGESYLIPEGALDAGSAWTHYVKGELEPLSSQLVADGDPRTLMLRVLALTEPDIVGAIHEDDVIEFLDSSLAAHQSRAGGQAQWSPTALKEAFSQLESAHLTRPEGEGYVLTPLGRFAGESGVHVDSIIRLSYSLQAIDPNEIKSTTLIAAAQLTAELDETWISATVYKNGGGKEVPLWFRVLAQQQVPARLITAIRTTGSEISASVRRAKRASAAIYWMNGIEMPLIEGQLNQYTWQRPSMAGAVRSVTDRTRDLLPAVKEVLAELFPTHAVKIGALTDRTIIRLELGIPASCVELGAAVPYLSRTQLLSLDRAALSTPSAVIEAPIDTLIELVGSREIAERVMHSCAYAVENKYEEADVEISPPSE